jgi:IS30 family transposase
MMKTSYERLDRRGRIEIEKAFKNIPKHLKLSLTYDKGTEMA